MRDRFYAVGIGASAGGLMAMKEFFHHLPKDTNAAFIVVTHLERNFRSNLDSILAKVSPLPVSRITHGGKMERNHVYVMPENVTLTIEDDIFRLKTRNPEDLMNRAIDIFFGSLAKDQGEYAVAVVLSGMGTDGSLGVEQVHKSGGAVFVQDPHTTVFSTMPQAAIRLDDPDVIQTPGQLAKTLVKFLNEKQSAR